MPTAERPASDEPPFISPFEIIKGYVRAAGGGVVVIVVDRDTEQYPSIGAEVAMVCERKADG